MKRSSQSAGSSTIAGIEAMPDDLREVLAAFQQSQVFAAAMGALHESFCAVRSAEHDHMRDMTFDEIVAVMVERI